MKKYKTMSVAHKIEVGNGGTKTRNGEDFGGFQERDQIVPVRVASLCLQ